ncbi:MAG: hypothetical protein EBV24_09935 [Actinobacteria bacterium]|nr:hypothetical protein [Actinomycetota bacterium]
MKKVDDVAEVGKMSLTIGSGDKGFHDLLVAAYLRGQCGNTSSLEDLAPLNQFLLNVEDCIGFAGPAWSDIVWQEAWITQRHPKECGGGRTADSTEIVDPIKSLENPAKLACRGIGKH